MAAAFFFLLGMFQCALLWHLGRIGKRLEALELRERELARLNPPNGWPACALITPVAGIQPATEAALRSLAEQNYPGFRLYLVTQDAADAAAPLIQALARQHGNIEHVIAGEAVGRGQKNQNSLAGVAAAAPYAEILAFCDSTHIAHADFLRCLVAPIARNEAEFTTGYHVVEPSDQRIVTLAYALSAMFMRFMQAAPGLAQPWGGAMAMSRAAFARYQVGALWAGNVVDDCSLAALLAKEKARVRLCPGALLRTRAANHAFGVWSAWLKRQVLFLKFCMPAEWLALGLVCFLMAAPPCWCVGACLDGILGEGGGAAPFLALCWLCVLGWMIGPWRRLLALQPAISRWLSAFFAASFMFALIYLGTIFTNSIVWSHIRYRVGKGGRVIAMKREKGF